MMVYPAPEKKKRNESRWRLCKKKAIKRYIRDAQAALAAAEPDGDTAASAALSLVEAALEVSPRMEEALELRARALVALRRYGDVADMLRDYIPSCAKSQSGDNTTSSLPTSSSSRSGDRTNASSLGFLSGFLCCFHVDLTDGISESSNDETEWRYLVLGQACFHLGLLEDAVVLLQTHRRVARESKSNLDSAGMGWMPQAGEEEHPVSQLLAQAKSLLWRRTAAVAAMDDGFPAEAVRQFSKVLDARHGGVLPHSFAAVCLVGRAAAFRAAGRPAEAITDCNRALALDPAFIPALRARADLLESVGMIVDSRWDLEYLKILYDVALRHGNLPGPSWRPQGGVRQGEIPVAHRELVACIQKLRRHPDGCGVDYYALLGVSRGCTRSELVRAHRLLTVKLKPDLSAASFPERLELVEEHRSLKDVRDQARMSAQRLYRMLHKGFLHVSAVLDAEQRRGREDVATDAAC